MPPRNKQYLFLILGKTKNPLGGGFFVLRSLCWRLATFPKRVSSPLSGLTSVFGMRTGVPPTSNHQHKNLKFFFENNQTTRWGQDSRLES